MRSNRSHLVLQLLLILVHEPLLSIVTEGQFIGAHELHVPEILRPLGDDPSDFGGNQQVHLEVIQII